MSPKMQEFGIDRLSVNDRLALVYEIWDSIAAESESFPLTEEQKQILERRVSDLNANPNNVLTWEEIKQSILGRE